jgi:hypothetical protein
MTDTNHFDPETQKKLAAIDLSMQARQFLSAPLGKFLSRRAQAHVELHTEQLKTMDILADPKAALRTQMEIRLGETFMYWLADLLNEGAELTQELVAEERARAGIDSDGAPHGDPQP